MTKKKTEPMQSEEYELITLPKPDELKLNLLNRVNFDYSFKSFPITVIQDNASRVFASKVRKGLLENISFVKDIGDSPQSIMAATFPKDIQDKIDAGKLIIRKAKNGPDWAQVVDPKKPNIVVKQANIQNVDLINNATDFQAMQSQLADIAEQLEKMNRLVERIETGQYNDRFAGFFSARQKMLEAMTIEDEDSMTAIFLGAINTANDTIAKLQVTIHEDVNAYLGGKLKKDERIRIQNLIENSFGYLNSTVQLNISSYTALGYKDAALVALRNYQSFVKQTLLSTYDDAWSLAKKLDNATSGNDHKWEEISTSIDNTIEKLIEGDSK